MPACAALKMRLFLFILPFLTFTKLIGQISQPKDAVYKSQKSDCDIKYDKSVKSIFEVSDTIVLLFSDKGKLIVEREDFRTSLELRDKNYKSIDTDLQKDSLVKFLFLNDILNYDNLLKSSTADRVAISQYGDTINTTLSVNSTTIKLYDIVWTSKIETKKTRVFNFDISFIFANNPYSIFHFDLIIETDKKISDIKQILSTIPKLKCLRYTGCEI